MFTKTGHILGYAAVFPSRHERANMTSHLVLMRPTKRLLPEFLAAYLRSEAGQDQIYRWGQKATKPELNTIEIRRFLIPIPSREEQTRLVQQLRDSRAVRQAKLKQADDLLSSLDGFILDALGLTLPPSDRRIAYAARLRDAQVRFDADYHSPRFRTLREKIEYGKYKPRSIKSLCDFIQSGFAAGGDDQTDNPAIGVPHIRPLNITNTAELTFEGTKMVPRAKMEPGDFLRNGEILFNNTNSTAWVGKSVVFNADRECACSNHITRLRLANNENNPYFVAAVFNALRGLGYFGLLSTNFNNQAGINVETLERVLIPIPLPREQANIAAEIARRRKEARRLRDEATRIWEDAKRRFQEELLGPVPSTGGKAKA